MSTRTTILALTLLGCAGRLPPDDCTPRFLDTAVGTLRPLSPMTAALVATRRPLVRWNRRDIAADRCVRVEFCRDRDCRQPISHTDLAGDRAAPPRELPPGLVFWRVRGEGAVSPTWYFYVPRGARSVVDGRSMALRSQFDVDGDGLGDLIHQLGAVYRQLPRAGLAEAPRFERWAQLDTDSLRPVQSAGDLDGDGHLDIVAVHTNYELTRIEALVYRGPLPRGDAPAALRIGGADFPGRGTRLGPGVPPAVHGDFNGDGYSDLAIGTLQTTGMPAVYILAGGPSLTDALRQPRQALRNVAVNGEFHQPLAARDLDGDGRDELIAGAFDANGYSGYVAIYRGLDAASGELVSALPLWDRYGTANSMFGVAVAVADLTGDGTPELVISSPTENSVGCVHVHPITQGAPTRDPALTRCAVPRTGASHLGYTLDAADLDGDGLADLAAGSIGEAPFTAVVRGARSGLSDGVSYRDTPPGSRDPTWVHTAFVSATDHADLVVLTSGTPALGPWVYPGVSTSPLPTPSLTSP